MKNLKSKLITLSVFFLALGLGAKANTCEVKADAAIKSQQGVVIRSANLTTEKVIKVPDRTAERQKEQQKKTNSVSRGTTTSSAGSTSNIVSYAYRFMGTPYVWGASGPRAFDCSGFTAYVYSNFGVSLPHYTGSQVQMGQAVSKNALAPGDLVFFNTDGPISHVGIYIGGDQFIHASSGSSRVTVSELSASYYAQRYAGARRILK